MFVKLMVLGVYAGVLFGVGWWARSKWSASPQNYFLADRGLGPFVFLATMAATNFSAFTVFGASGAGYRDGYAFYPIVGFGTGFMALTFWFIGRKARELALEHGAVTPPGLVRAVYGSRFLSSLFAAVLIVFTLPYLALQPIAAGYALKELLGWPHFVGAAAVTGIICLYTLRGGLKAVAWTDVFQGLLMFFVLILALVLTAGKVGGLAEAGQKLMAEAPQLFSRPGGEGKYLPPVWFSFMFLWFFCDPMFPQLFQRFMAANDDRTIRRTMLAYPFICSAVFLPPVTLGVLGRLSHPGLTGKAADGILPLVAADMNNPVLGALIVVCGLAALMSTMDSQLLTLSSIFSQDIYPLAGGKHAESAWPGRVFVILLSCVGLALAVNPPGTILSIASQAFTGLAVLFPTVLFGLYPGWKSTSGAITSIIAGQVGVALDLLGLLPTGGFMAVVPIMGLSFGAYILVSWGEGARARLGRSGAGVGAFIKSPYTWGFLLILALAQDWWRWGAETELVLGYPVWLLHFLFLSAAQTWLMARWTRAVASGKIHGDNSDRA
ncbi:MAG: sodium:solute symporter family protein [Pseudomonadota bacterium]